MAHFDSSKNRALWKRELDSLRREKERRLREGYNPEEPKKMNKSADIKNPFVQKMTFAELQREEMMERSKRMRQSEHAPRRQRERQNEYEQQKDVSKEMSL